mmetsp:Transcript_9555/g.19860  ORF Transcript_9555/g.19860 Transcript_9555/m.19860 type:complete len:209 (-) Transcript_9555:746-1372(-)
MMNIKFGLQNHFCPRVHGKGCSLLLLLHCHATTDKASHGQDHHGHYGGSHTGHLNLLVQKRVGNTVHHGALLKLTKDSETSPCQNERNGGIHGHDTARHAQQDQQTHEGQSKLSIRRHTPRHGRHIEIDGGGGGNPTGMNRQGEQVQPVIGFHIGRARRFPKSVYGPPQGSTNAHHDHGRERDLIQGKGKGPCRLESNNGPVFVSNRL